MIADSTTFLRAWRGLIEGAAGVVRPRPRTAFISHAHEQRHMAEAIAVRLRARGYNAFLDRDTLAPASAFDAELRQAVMGCDLFLFLVSPDSVAATRYTLTELQAAQRRWPNPVGRVLPVMAAETPTLSIPPYLAQLNILRTRAEPVEEVARAAAAMLGALRSSAVPRAVLFGLALLSMLVALGLPTWRDREPMSGQGPDGVDRSGAAGVTAPAASGEQAPGAGAAPVRREEPAQKTQMRQPVAAGEGASSMHGEQVVAPRLAHARVESASGRSVRSKLSKRVVAGDPPKGNQVSVSNVSAKNLAVSGGDMTNTALGDEPTPRRRNRASDVDGGG